MLQNRNREHGSALVYVFIGLILFAGLIFTFSKSFQNSNDLAADQQGAVAANDLLTFSNQVEQSVQKLIIKGCSETEISFENLIESGYTNPSSPVGKSCHVFDPQGGNMAWRSPPIGVNDGSTWAFVGGPVMHNANGAKSDYTNQNAELVIYLFSLTEETCAAINSTQNIPGIPVDSSNIGAAAKFTGTFLAQENITGSILASQPSPCMAALPEPHLCGRSTACFREEDAGQRYVFVRTLYAR